MYCTTDDLEDYLLEQYLTKVEDLKPGSADRHIAKVSAEIDEALLQGGFDVPETNTSAMLTRICAVMCDWLLVGEITSLMASEGSVDNEWIPLQKLYLRAEKDLDKIREGKLNPFPSEGGDDSSIEVSAPDQIFTSDKWKCF